MTRFAFLILLVLAACSPRSDAEAPAPDQVSAAEVKEVLYVDVRTPEEYATGHIVGALNIPHDQMEKRWQELAVYKDRPVVLYCASGGRSGMATKVLQSKGFSQAENGGGFEELAAQGLPTER